MSHEKNYHHTDMVKLNGKIEALKHKGFFSDWFFWNCQSEEGEGKNITFSNVTEFAHMRIFSFGHFRPLFLSVDGIGVSTIFGWKCSSDDH